MFVFGDEGSRRFGLPAVLTLVTVACAAVVAARWQPEARPVPAPAPSFSRPPPSCTPGTGRLYAVTGEGGTVDPRALSTAILKYYAEDCEFLTAHDPQRAGFTATAAARAEAADINAGVTAAICPEPAACSAPRAGTTANVAVIRDALVRLGYPGAEVRPAKYVGESPEEDIVFGVPLRSAAGCLVSFVRVGLGAAPMGPVGMLRGGRCLHEA